MVGEKFKSLTVITLDEEKNNGLRAERKNGLRNGAPVYYMCECDCGNILSLSKQKIKSRRCFGCKKCKNIDFKKYISKQINSWAIIDYKYKNNMSFFECKCACGEIKEVNAYNVINNQSKDCGCGRKEFVKNIHFVNLVGQKFGRLTPIKILGLNKHRKTIYECICDCGNTHITIGSCLSSKGTLSCGCLHSKMNSKIAQFLREENVEFIPEKHCWYDDKSYGRFDFFLPEYNLAIEYDGESHYMPIDYAGKGERWATEHFKRTQYRDAFKNQYCKDNDINLLRIPYWEKENFKTIILNYIIALND